MKTLFLFLLLCAPAFARIGETRAQCEARYGPPVEVRNEGEITVHQKDGFAVRCTYFEGKCEAIVFSKAPANPAEGNLPLSDAEHKTLMDANSGGKTWVKLRENAEHHFTVWRCEGMRAWHDGKNHQMEIFTDAHGAREDAKLAAKRAADKAAKDKADGKGSLKNF
ncbi:hypothetical protein [Brevifollis gellanilyticus]|uniref:Uncharacterized protein n=1 Tax=Brevifollis gellanilyticus TaxID=748831 RepID=A0A512MI43_9BACT|nr:hypothetical protein [Brevifollis gellanilyticus]GEP46403.1 hypothetical protein BGE01nite_56940 [Brevifollis gellanilyticus]